MADYLKKASLRRANAMPDLTNPGKSPGCDSQKTEIDQDLFADTLRCLNLCYDCANLPIPSLYVLPLCDTFFWPDSAGWMRNMNHKACCAKFERVM